MRYAYRAVTADGRIVSGQLDATGTDDLENRLHRLSLDLITGHPANQGHQSRAPRISRRELINFCFHLEQQARAGVPILEGLADLRDSLEDADFRAVIANLIEDIEGGHTLSEAMAGQAGTFSPVVMNLISAGESSGQLPEILASLTESLKWEDELAAHSKKLLIYPTVVAGVVFATSVFLMLYLVPQLKSFVRNMGQTLPWSTRSLFFVSELLISYWPVFFSVPILVMIAARIALRRSASARLQFDRYKLQLPILGAILKKISLARFAGTFAMLYAAGIPILEAIGSTRRVVGNLLVEQALQDAEQSIREGRHVTAAFAECGLFPPLVIRMLRVGESTGRLDTALYNVSYFYNRDVREAVGKLQSMIEPLLTIVMGLILGWIMLSVIGPIYDVISRIRL